MDIKYKIKMKNKIDLLTCSFSDKELESKYQDVRWNEVSSFYSNVLKFFLIIGIIYLLSLYLRNSLDIKTVFRELTLFSAIPDK